MKFQMTQLALLVALTSAAYAQNTTIPELDKVKEVVKSIRFINEHPNQIWPRFKIASPSVLYFDDNNNTTHDYAFNFTPTNPRWQPLNLEQQTIYYLPKDEYELNNAGDNATIDGQNVSVVKDQFYTGLYDNAKNLIQSKFIMYAISNQLLTPDLMNSTAYRYTDENTINDIKFAYLEREALIIYLQTHSESALMDAVAIQQQVRKTAASTTYYSFISGLQGSGAYAATKSLNLNDSQFDQYLISDVYAKYCQAKDTGSSVPGENQNDILMQLTGNCAVFFTETFSHALDSKVDPATWKANVENQKKSPDILIQEYYQLPEAVAQSRTIEAMQNPAYHFDAISSTVDKLMKNYLTEARTALNNYNSQVGTKTKFINVEFSGYFTSSPIEYNIATNQHLLVQKDKKSSQLDTYSFDNQFGFVKTSEIKLSPLAVINLDGDVDTITHYVSIASKKFFKNAVITDGTTRIEIATPTGEKKLLATVENNELSFSNSDTSTTLKRKNRSILKK